VRLEDDMHATADGAELLTPTQPVARKNGDKMAKLENISLNAPRARIDA